MVVNTIFPKISVVIPLYNKGAFIRRALNSVFTQTFEDYEVIVVDDGSTDDGPNIVASFDAIRLRVIRQENSGPGATRNRGINNALGEYIAFLDADDEWLPDYLEKSYRILEGNQSCDICISAWYQDYAKGDRLYIRHNILDVYQSVGIVIDEGPLHVSEIHNTKTLLFMWWTGTVFVRKRVFLNKYRFYDTSRHTYGEDHYLWIQLAFNHTFYRNNEPLAWYHNEASDLSLGGYAISPLEAFMLWPEMVVANTAEERRKRVRTWLASYALASAHIRLGVGQYDNAVLLLRKFPDMILPAPIKSSLLLLKIALYRIGLYKPCHT